MPQSPKPSAASAPPRFPESKYLPHNRPQVVARLLYLMELRSKRPHKGK